MLDQNLTTLLSTLFGGLLAIIGGVVTNHYLQSSSNKTNKQKEIRNLIEQIYKYTRDIYYIVYYMNEDHSKWFENTKEGKDFQWNLYNIEMLVNLYLPQLKEPFRTYNEDLDNLVSYIDRLQKPPQPKHTSITDITNTFRESLTALLRKEGYSYF